jgi:hypothetical protein
MNSPGDRDPDRQLQFLLNLVDDKAFIDGDVLEISDNTWAIHGEIAVEGEILMAEFDTYDQARNALELLRRAARPPSDIAE